MIFAPLQALKRDGVKGFIEELTAIIPIEQLRMLYEEKMENSSAFLQFMITLRKLNYLEIQHFYTVRFNTNYIIAINHNAHITTTLFQCSRELRSFVQVLRSFGIDVDHWENSIRAFLGWKRHV